jgi:hypothetical protein
MLLSSSRRPKGISGALVLMAPSTDLNLTCVLLLLVAISPGTPIMLYSRLRRAASFTVATLVALVGSDVGKVAPDVTLLHVGLPAGIARSDDLASTVGMGPLPRVRPDHAHCRRPSAHRDILSRSKDGCFISMFATHVNTTAGPAFRLVMGGLCRGRCFRPDTPG